jgi:hypothetical protein
MVEESLIGGGLWLLRLEEEEFSSPVSMGEVMGEGEGRRKKERKKRRSRKKPKTPYKKGTQIRQATHNKSFTHLSLATRDRRIRED